MCGTGESNDNDSLYIPMIPQHDNISKAEGEEVFPEGICPAFKERIQSLTFGNLEQILRDKERVLNGKQSILNNI